MKLKIQLLKKIEIQNSSALRKIDSGKSYCEKSAVQCSSSLEESSITVQWKLKALKRRKGCLKKNSKLLKQVIKTSRKILMKNEAFSKLNFAMSLDSMKLQCQFYYSGALIGNNVHKLTKNENISDNYQMIQKKNFLHMRMS